MMFILTLKDKPEGVFSVVDDDGEQVIPIFECEDDAERYQIQLDDLLPNKYVLQIIEIDEEVIVAACEERDQKYSIITEDDFIVPPTELA